MPYNMILCSKVAENTKILKIAKFAIYLAPDLRNHPKNDSLNRELLNFFIGMV